MDYLKSLLVSFIVTVICIFIFIFIAEKSILVEFLDKSNCVKTDDVQIVCTFVADNAWNESAYLSIISSFYSNIIVLLVVIITIVSWLSYFVLKNTQRHVIEEEVEERMPNILKNTDVQLTMKDTLEPVITKLVANELTEIQKQIEELQNENQSDTLDTNWS